MGNKEDGKDSLAQQVEPETHWPELRILVLVVGLIVGIGEWQQISENNADEFALLQMQECKSYINLMHFCHRPVQSRSQLAAPLECKPV